MATTRCVGGGGLDNVQGGVGDDVVRLASTAEFAAGELIDGGADTDTLRYTGTVAATLMLTAGVTNIEQVQIANVAGLTTGLAAINVNAAAVTTTADPHRQQRREYPDRHWLRRHPYGERRQRHAHRRGRQRYSKRRKWQRYPDLGPS